MVNCFALLKIPQLTIFSKLILYRQKKPLCSSKAARVSSVPLLFQIVANYHFYCVYNMKINQLLEWSLTFIKCFPTVFCCFFELLSRNPPSVFLSLLIQNFKYFSSCFLLEVAWILMWFHLSFFAFLSPISYLISSPLPAKECLCYLVTSESRS